MVSGALGGAVGALSRGQFDALSKAVERDVTVPDGVTDVYSPGNLPASVGAAADNTGTSAPKAVTGSELADKTLAKLGPVTRVEFGESAVARRIMGPSGRKCNCEG